MEEVLNQILVNEYRGVAENQEWEDIRFLEDEELLFMNPATPYDKKIIFHPDVTEYS